MQFAAHWALLISLLAALMLSGLAAWQLHAGRAGAVSWLETGQAVLLSLLTAASVVLFVALYRRDFSYLYVAEYTDLALPLFYAVTAFWAGQAGSLLFWAWMTALVGVVFALSKSYEGLEARTKLHFWMLFLAVEAFFLLLLTGPSTPFMRAVPTPADGKGLNPLLQNPGMIFHPPLLFLGYAGFAVPGCLALAAWLSGERTSWIKASRGLTLVSWVMLTAGIVLGGWWSYMELGWGGYWAWDPVENASLIPWLSATAFMHTAVVEVRRGALRRTNVLLMAVTLILCFFGTYLVRSGVVESLHAFGEGGVGRPLLLLILFGLVLTGVVLALGKPAGQSRPLSGPASLPGLLTLAAWLFLALSAVVFLGTMWPVISRIWSENTVGLDAGFYNRVCNPLFVAVALLLVVCPWMSWGEGVRRPRLAGLSLGVLAISGVVFYVLGYRSAVPLVGAAAGTAALVTAVIRAASDPAARRPRGGLGAWMLHAGLSLMVVGVAISGPYQISKEAIVALGQTIDVGPYRLTYRGLDEIAQPGYVGARAVLAASRDGKPLGELTPERRAYKNFPQPFAEVSVIPSLGDELYATLLAFSDDKSASFKVSVNPLVNWVWIGGTLVCLAGLACLWRYPEREK